MLSPDVPEFVPREFQDREVPSNIESSVTEHVNVEASVGFHPVPSYPLYHYSQPPHCSPERVLNDGVSNWSSVAVHSQPWEERTTVCSSYGSHQNPYKPNNAADGNWRNSSDDTWKNSSNDNWRTANSGSRNSNRYSRDENSRRGIQKKKTTGRLASNDTSQEVKQTGTEKKKSQVHSTDDISQGKGNVLPLNDKSSPSTVEQFKAGASASTVIIQDAKQQSKQVSVVKKRDTFQEGRQVPQDEGAVKEHRQVTTQREIDPQVIAGSVNYDRGKVHSHGKGDWPGFTKQGKYKDEISYKKILSRKKEDNILTEKLQPTINLIPTQSDAQWPSLSPAHHQNLVDKSYDNVWVKKDNHLESSKWPRPSPDVTTLTTASSSDSPEIKILDRKKGNKGKNKQGKQLVTNDKTFVESEATQFKDSQQSRERFKHADGTWFKDSRQSKERGRQTEGNQFKDLHQSKDRIRQTEGTRSNDSHQSKERVRQTEGTRSSDSHQLKERVRQTEGTRSSDSHQLKERVRQTDGTQFNDSHQSKERVRQTEGNQFKDSQQSKDRVRQTQHRKPGKASYCEENMNPIKDETVASKSHNFKPLKERHKNYDSEKTDNERFEKREKGTSKDEVRYRNNHDRSDRLQRRLSQPSVNEKDVKITKNTKFESEENNSAKEEDSEWQVKTKKKGKVREPQEDDSSKALRFSKSRNREKGIENRESSHSNNSKTRKYNDSRDACVDSKNKKKGRAGDTGSLASEKKGDVMAKNRAHMKTDFVKNGQGDNTQNQTFSRETSNISRSNETSKHSGTVSRNMPSGLSGTKDRQNLRKSAVSGEEKTDVEDEATRILNIERKAKKKEEKMRKRESKVKRAQALMLADTKVTMVSKDVIDLMYRGSNQKKKKSSVPEEKYYLDDKSFQYSVDEYPTLMADNSRVTTINETFVEPVLDSISDEEGHLQFSAKEYPSLTDQEVTRGRKPEGISTKSRVLGSDSCNVNRKENDVRERYGTFTTDVRVEKKDTAVPLVSQSAVPSYSRALLASPRKKVVSTSAPEEVVPKKIMTAKKKVKSKDGITFDLMAAVTKKKGKKKDRNSVDLTAVLNRKPKTRDCIELDLSAAAAKRKIRIKSRDVLLTALDPKFLEKIKSETSAKKGTKGDPSVIKPGKSKRTTKLRSEVVVKRGKQQEGQRKKKLSTLKKAMKRARQMEVETLLSVMQEAQKLQENVIATSDGTCASSDSPLKQIEPLEETLKSSKSLESSAIDDITEMGNISDGAHTVSLNGSKNILTSDCVNEIAQNCDSPTEVVCGKDNKDLSNMNLKGSADVPSEISKKEENETEDQNSSVCPSETVSNVVDAEYSKKCQNMAEEIKQLWNPVHKKTFREYCNHVVTPEVDLAAKELIRTLVRFQERHFQRDPVKARIRRRYVCGLKSTTKAMGKLSCVIAAPNIERCKGPGALDEVVEKMLSQAEKHGVPVIFALTCKRIGYLCLKAIAVSCIGIINYHGAQDIFHKLMDMIPEAQKQYQQLIAGGSRTLPIGDGESSDEESGPVTKGITNEFTLSNATLSSDIPKGNTAESSSDIPKGNTAESDSLVASRNIKEVKASTIQNKKSDKHSFPLLQETSGDMAAVTTIPEKKDGKSVSVPQNTREEVIAYTVAILSGETDRDPLLPLSKDNGEETIDSTLVGITGETEE